MPPRGATSPQRRSVFEPQCTHLTMTRIYDTTLLCVVCRRPGPSGWVYHCSQDREDLIEHAICRGEMASFDVLGRHISERLRIRRGSPAAREDRLSFFAEISPRQMASYRPDQVAAILRQRENVQAVIQLQRLRNDSSEIINGHTYSHVFEGSPGPFEYKKPWVRSVREECQYRVCSRCRPGLADRAFLGLDAVAHGEIPPTAAVGFGFHIMGERPVVDAEILKRLGHRSDMASSNDRAGHYNVFDLPMTSQQPTSPSETLSGRGSFRSRESIRQLFEDSATIEQATESDLHASRKRANTPGSLKHSPRCGNLSKYVTSNNDSDRDSIPCRLWTPPPSPSPNVGKDSPRGQSQAAIPDGHATRESSPASSRLVTSPGGRQADQDSPFFLAGQKTRPLPQPHSAASRNSALDSAEGRSEGPGSLHESAVSPPRHVVEAEGMGKFTPSPLEVGHGVAVLEESVELGVPDLVTHASELGQA